MKLVHKSEKLTLFVLPVVFLSLSCLCCIGHRKDAAFKCSLTGEEYENEILDKLVKQRVFDEDIEELYCLMGHGYEKELFFKEKIYNPDNYSSSPHDIHDEIASWAFVKLRRIFKHNSTALQRYWVLSLNEENLQRLMLTNAIMAEFRGNSRELEHLVDWAYSLMGRDWERYEAALYSIKWFIRLSPEDTVNKRTLAKLAFITEGEPGEDAIPSGYQRTRMLEFSVFNEIMKRKLDNEDN